MVLHIPGNVMLSQDRARLGSEWLRVAHAMFRPLCNDGMAISNYSCTSVLRTLSGPVIVKWTGG